MSIISQTTWDKFTQEEKNKLKELYSNSVKVDLGVMRKIFGEEALQPQPLTYEDVARELGTGDFKEFNLKLEAIGKLLVVAKFLNKDWKPYWENKEEKKFYLSLYNNEIRISYVWGDNSSCVYFRTEELAKQSVAILGEDTVRLALGNF